MRQLAQKFHNYVILHMSYIIVCYSRVISRLNCQNIVELPPLRWLDCFLFEFICQILKRDLLTAQNLNFSFVYRYQLTQDRLNKAAWNCYRKACRCVVVLQFVVNCTFFNVNTDESLTFVEPDVNPVTLVIPVFKNLKTVVVIRVLGVIQDEIILVGNGSVLWGHDL